MNTHTSSSSPSLNDCIDSVRVALLEGTPRPDILYLSATGVGPMRDRLVGHASINLGEFEGTPDCWAESVLHAGQLGTLNVWMLDDENFQLKSPSAWFGGFPVWLAAACGAGCLLHTSAGFALPLFRSSSGLVLAQDHIRFGDDNPLEALGTTSLGPLFPDLSLLHDQELRNNALARAEELGIDVVNAIVACTQGPALETRAERAMLASFGAQVCVQSLAAPLLAAGHAGMRLLSIIAITDGGDQPGDMKRQLQSAEILAPQIDDLITALIPDLESRVRALKNEQTL